MRFEETAISGAYLIHLEKHEDDRGFFARTWCKKEFAGQGLSEDLVQANISYNKKAGTLRGLHYQIAPYQEAKHVRCFKGSIFDVIIDLRQWSPTYLNSLSFTLDDYATALYVPKGLAHGFLTLENDTLVTYLISNYYNPRSARGIRWDDPLFHISWPREITMISEKDKSWPNFTEEGVKNAHN
ncbi:MAG: dTDP-4-dehydrorhamnose 3,5-epimerase [Bacillota bacterium]